MCKKSCLSCKNYKPKETKVVGREWTCDGMMSVPVYKEIPHHCDKHPRYFKKRWNEVANKTTKDPDYIEPKCYEPNEFTKELDKMIDLANDILNNIKV